MYDDSVCALVFLLVCRNSVSSTRLLIDSRAFFVGVGRQSSSLFSYALGLFKLFELSASLGHVDQRTPTGINSYKGACSTSCAENNCSRCCVNSSL